jgi:aryl-alcohol dehydrogenase-like predicted oxidoreductase
MTQNETIKMIKGCWQYSTGHGGASATNVVGELLQFADAGITTFDCADIYTGVEELLGQFREAYVKQHGREALTSIKVHTKFVPDLDILPTINRAYVERIIDRSLQRLQTERLDLVQFHWWDFAIPGYVETARILSDLQREGKIEHIGVTNCDVKHLQEILNGNVRIVSNQVQYSVLDDRPEHGMAEFCAKQGIGLLCYGVVSGGFLSEKYLGQSEPSDLFENRSLAKYKLVINDAGGWNVYQKVLESLNLIAQKHGTSVASVAIRYVLDKPQVKGVIFGGGIKYIVDIQSSLELKLNDEDKEVLDIARKRLTSLKGDVYALERIKNGIHSSIMKYNLNG